MSAFQIRQNRMKNSTGEVHTCEVCGQRSASKLAVFLDSHSVPICAKDAKEWQKIWESAL